MPAQEDALREARHAYSTGDMSTARAAFIEAARSGSLLVDDRLGLADASWWTGDNQEALAGYEEAFNGLLELNAPAKAAKLALDIGFLWVLRGDFTVGSGWLTRGRRLLDALPECVEHGFGLAVEMDDAISELRFEDAIATARRIQDLASRFGDPTLTAIGLAGEGRALIRSGQTARGISILDEAMLPIAAGSVSPDWVGNIYCQLMGICHDLADFRRAWEWTEATERWCSRFSSAVMFLGVCRMHRAQLLQIRGEWDDAESEAERVCQDLADMNIFAVAESFYQIGEVRRLRGDLRGAEESYRRAHHLGRDPHPGLALVRVAQGRVGNGLGSLKAALASETDDFARARLLDAQVEVALAASEDALAEAASSELQRIADTHRSPGMSAMAAAAAGAVTAARGDHTSAMVLLRDAIKRWSELGSPYRVARARVTAGQVLQALGDTDGAALELESASSVFAELGAGPDLRAIRQLGTGPPGGLTAREAEVLSHIASGQTNREVATTLFIAEKTVARHLSNIFTKLGVSTRTEAAAFAHHHGMTVHRRA